MSTLHGTVDCLSKECERLRKEVASLERQLAIANEDLAVYGRKLDEGWTHPESVARERSRALAMTAVLLEYEQLEADMLESDDHKLYEAMPTGMYNRMIRLAERRNKALGR